MRQRHSLYLSEAMTQRLQIMAETHRVSKSAILERSLQQYLAVESGRRLSDLQILPHEATTRSLRRLERDLAIATELTATFVRYFLTIIPPLPESEHSTARALGRLRFDQVIEDIGKRLRTDRGLIARIMVTMAGEPGKTTSDIRPRDDDDAAPASNPVPERPKPDHADG